MAAANKHNLLTKETLQTAFHMLDKVFYQCKDGSGTISVAELKQQFGDQLPKHVWEERIQEADENNDGEVRF